MYEELPKTLTLPNIHMYTYIHVFWTFEAEKYKFWHIECGTVPSAADIQKSAKETI